MAADTGADGVPFAGEPAFEARLGPAELHDTVRHRLEELTQRWDLRPADAHQLAQQIRTRPFAPGEIILPRRARANFWGLIARGLVGVYRDPSRPGQPVAILLPGSTLGNGLATESRLGSSTLRAITRCEVWFLRLADLQALAQERQTERRMATLGRVLRWGALAWIVVLLAVLILSLPGVRHTVALVPMALGQGCSERGSDGGLCREWTWALAGSLAPEDPNPPLALGTLYFQRGQLEMAERWFEAARALAPDLAEVYNNLGLVYAARGEHARAIAAFQRALDLEPGMAAVEQNLGLSLQAVHVYDQALIHYQRSIAFGEPQAKTLVNLAIARYEVGQLDEASKMARQALQADPALAPAHAVLGAIALEMQEPETALPHLRQAVALDAGYAPAYYYLGLAYEATGQPAEAIAALEQALARTDDTALRDQSRRHLRELYLTVE